MTSPKSRHRDDDDHDDDDQLFFRMIGRRKALSLVSSRDYCQRFSPSQIPDTPRAGSEPVENLSSGFVQGSCTLLITTTPRLTNQNFITS